MKKIRVIIIDDERTARNEIKRLLDHYSDFEITGEAKNAAEARLLIESKRPDLLFLDIQMPGESGFDLLESLDEVPDVIFTTAFDEFAVKAFEISALDYLVKPIREERFAKAMERAIKTQEGKKISTTTPEDRRIFIRDGQQCYFVQLTGVYLIESVDNYARLHFNGGKALIKSSLNQLEEKLDKNLFFRINRYQVINTAFIQNIDTVTKGRLKISLQTGELLDVSDRQSAKFKNRGRL